MNGIHKTISAAAGVKDDVPTWGFAYSSGTEPFFNNSHVRRDEVPWRRHLRKLWSGSGHGLGERSVSSESEFSFCWEKA